MRHKVLIFDCGFGEEQIEKRLKDTFLVDTERISITKSNNLSETVDEICEKAKKRIGHFDVIVIAHPELALIALSRLRAKYAEQQFAGYDGDMTEDINSASEVLVLASTELKRTEQYQRMKAKHPSVVEPNLEKWIEVVSCKNKLKAADFSKGIKAGVKVVILQDGLLLQKKRIEQIIGWRGEVVDFNNRVVSEIGKKCGILKWF